MIKSTKKTPNSSLSHSWPNLEYFVPNRPLTKCCVSQKNNAPLPRKIPMERMMEAWAERGIEGTDPNWPLLGIQKKMHLKLSLLTVFDVSHMISLIYQTNSPLANLGRSRSSRAYLVTPVIVLDVIFPM